MNILLLDTNKNTIILMKAFIKLSLPAANVIVESDVNGIVNSIAENNVEILIVCNDNLMPIIDSVKPAFPYIIAIGITVDENNHKNSSYNYILQKPVRKADFRGTLASAILKNYAMKMRRTNETNKN